MQFSSLFHAHALESRLRLIRLKVRRIGTVKTFNFGQGRTRDYEGEDMNHEKERK